jgi:dTDP-4-dehydrorhamnose reductase
MEARRRAKWRADLRVLVVGASGQVGAELSRQLVTQGHQVIGTHQHVPAAGTVPLAVTDHAATAALIESSRADAVYFAAAYTHVDGCEDDPARAFAVNRDAPAAAARVAAQRGAAFVFYSTEYVFDGAAGPYAEDDPVHPISVYGESKLAGERGVLSADSGAIVIRTTVVYGVDAQEKNFVYQLLVRGRASERMKVPADQRSSPTYVEDLAAASLALVDKRAHGVFHVAGPEVVDRYELACDACRVFGLDPGFLDPVTTASLGQKAARPLDAGLRVERITGLGITMRGPRAGLTAMRAALGTSRG